MATGKIPALLQQLHLKLAERIDSAVAEKKMAT